MKKKKIVLNIMLLALLLLAFGQISFAEDIENLENKEDQEQIATEVEVAIVSLELENEVLITVDSLGVIIEIEELNKEDYLEIGTDENLLVDVIGLSLNEGIEKLSKDYESSIVFDVYSDNESLTESIKNMVMDSIEEEIVVENDINLNSERFDDAEEFGVTNGKMNLLYKLKESNDNELYLFDEWAEKSVQEIMKEIKNNRKENDEKSSENSMIREQVQEQTEAQEQIQEQTMEQIKEKVEKKTNNGSNNGKGKKK